MLLDIDYKRELKSLNSHEIMEKYFLPELGLRKKWKITWIEIEYVLSLFSFTTFSFSILYAVEYIPSQVSELKSEEEAIE